jgi:hypothetical protein
MSRYVIRNTTTRLLYSNNDVPETIFVQSKQDPSRNDPVSKLIPMFETTHPLMALKYEERVDAERMFSHPDLVDPAAFAGCEVVEAEFDSKNHAALR